MPPTSDPQAGTHLPLIPGAEAPTPAQGTPTPNAAPPSPPAKAEASQQGNDSTNVMLPQHAFKRIKEEARTKGKAEALKELASQAGFATVEEFTMALANLKNKPTRTEERPKGGSNGKPANGKSNGKSNGNAPVNTRPDKRQFDRLAREREKWEQERQQLSRQAKREADKRKELQQAIDAKDAEMALREAAVMAGVKDIDYAVRLLTRNLEGKSEEELAKFNEVEFFNGLKAEKPYLFGESVKPATTGTGPSGTQSPKPGKVEQVQAQGGQNDARKMSKEEFSKHLEARGLNIAM
jgi:hypothetical protein